ncbi:MAG TPA: sodium:solute symporter family protein, partial [Methanomassiliicoccales archaeon]|nr:sodium:solute symporter family protein [Methanomassiliicoccales archaeon]
YTVGALTNVYFWREDGMLSLARAGNTDSIMPLYINSAMPDIVVVFFMLTLLAAAMSTLSSLLHALGSAAGTDLWNGFRASRLAPAKYKCDVEGPCSLKANRYATIIMILVTLVVAFYMPKNIIAVATSMFMGLCASAFLPMFAVGVFAKRPSTLAAKLSLVTGTVVWFMWGIFVYGRYSDVFGINKALTGSVTLAGTPWSWIDPLFIALPAAIIALVIGWLIDPARKAVPAENPAA